MKSFVLLMACPDQPGIVARITGALYRFECNVLALEQHVEDGKLFFMRIEADVSESSPEFELLRDELQELAHQLKGTLTLTELNKRRRVAVLVGRDGACLNELLVKQSTGQLRCEIALIIGNYEDQRKAADTYGVRFAYVPTVSEIGGQHEVVMRQLIDETKAELVVLARYMKILSPEFVEAYEGNIINIHHGFLPAFKGAQPYQQAWDRGVKIIGATAHYVTAGLDEGPIISQDITRVTHQHSVAAMVETGRDIEKRVLAEAVKAHLESRILRHGARTIVFHQTD